MRHKTTIFEHDRLLCSLCPNRKWAWHRSVAGWCENLHTKVEVCNYYTFQVISVLKWKFKNHAIWSLFSHPVTYGSSFPFMQPSHLEVINESHMHRVPKSKHIWFSCCTDTMYPINYRLESKILYYYSIPEFFHAIAVIPMQVLAIMLNYDHFITEKTLAMNVVYIQIVTLASVSLALHPCCRHRWLECHCPRAGRCFTHFFELSQLTLPYWLLPRDGLPMHLAIIPA